MSVSNIDDARHHRLVWDMQRLYDEYQVVKGECIGKLQAKFNEMSAVEALLLIAQIQALDELRLEVAGYKPQPLQDVLQLAHILGSDAVETFKRTWRREARN